MDIENIGWIKEELCLECPDAPMETCKCGCMKKAIVNAIEHLKSENAQLRAYVHELETVHRTEMCEDGYDCVQLGKIRAELEQMEYRKDKEITRLGVQISSLMGELASLAAERDAAMEQLHGQCEYCKHKSKRLKKPCKECVWFAAKEFVKGTIRNGLVYRRRRRNDAGRSNQMV